MSDLRVAAVIDAEHRLELAQEALESAYVSRDAGSVRLHKYRVGRAHDALTRARHAEEYGHCECTICAGPS